MLISVLTEGDAKARQELARHIEGLGKAGGELVIIQREG